jgi:hypothetical protein
MTKISRYPIDTDVSGSDKWIGSDAEFYNATKNFTPDKVARYFNENQVIDTGANLRMRYVILDVGEERPYGSITFIPQQGTLVPFSSISSFIMSDKNTAGALVPNFIEFLQDTKVFISKTRDLNTFGYYKVTGVEEYLPEPDFYTITVEFISGNGSLSKDIDYVISFVSDMSDNGPIYTFTSPLINTSNVISIRVSSNTTDGYLSSIDWTTFNNKQAALSGEGFVKVSGSTVSYDNTTYFPFPLGTISEYVRGDGSISSFPSLTGYVPYTGATQDVNLGEFGLQTGNIEFDNTPTNIPTGAGSMYWNDADGTANLILKGGNVSLQVGQESVIRVVNKTATNINLLEANYQAVRVTGAQGQRLKVDLAQATTDSLSAETIGLVTETINNNQEGFVTTSGLVRNINTTGSLQGETWVDGDILYLSPTTAGNATKVKPVAPNHLIILGYVIHAHITQGSIFVKVDNGYELDELHNVKIATPTNNQALIYTSATDIWENKTIIEDAIVDGVTTKAPSQNAVFDALATKFTLPALTSGSVLFSNGTTIAQDNANFFWDDTNNRLGIGTTSPGYKLDISANNNRARLLGTTGYVTLDIQNTAGSLYIGRESSTGGSLIAGSAAYSGVISLQGNYPMYLGTNGLIRATILGSGSVGIGTTAPTAILHIAAPGALSTDIALRVRNSADNADLFTINGLGNATINGLSLGRGPGGFDTNTVFGKSALSVNTTGVNNTAIGLDSLFSNTTGTSNTAIGINSLRLNTTGGANVAIGINALINNTAGSNNTAVGAGTLLNSTGSNNVAIGLNSFLNISSGSNLTAIGLNSGRFSGSGTTTMTSCNNSIYLGAFTRGLNATGSTNEIVIGYEVVGLGSNSIVLGSSATTKTAIYGNLLLGTTTDISSAILNVNSTTQGVLFPRMTTTQKNAIATPATGLVVFDTTLNKLCVRGASAWETITSI